MPRLIAIFSAAAIAASVGCQSPPAEPPVVTSTDNRALRPSTRTYGYSDAEVEAMREKIKTLAFPAAPGETVRALGIELPPFSSVEIADFLPNDANLAASYRKTAPLNGRYQFVLVEHQYMQKDQSSKVVEHSAEIKRTAP